MSSQDSLEREFSRFVGSVEARPGYQRPVAFGIGLATVCNSKVLDVRFLSINFESNYDVAAVVAENVGDLATGTRLLSDEAIHQVLERLGGFGGANRIALQGLARTKPHHPVRSHAYQPVAVFLMSRDDEPVSAGDVYLRLHLLSLRYVQPRTLNLDGAFSRLNTNVWTMEGVIDQEHFDAIQRERVMEGRPFVVILQDKFPRMLDYCSPSGVRVVQPNNVRLGAHLAEGTVVMTAGAINFNAGTLGETMIEGRVSAGVVVGARSDVGGGASLMGTLSGGNALAVSLGEDCLVEAMAGLGIPVGDRVRIEVGFYVKSTTPIHVVADPGWGGNPIAAPLQGQVVKGRSLCGISDAVFRRSASRGTPEVVPRGANVWGQLNPDLHKN
jgi:2,3,4,5-tetrahydropyridine-2,6-dicarboxylate N-succinyltransferase